MARIIPSTNLAIGDDPAVERYSFVAADMRKAQKGAKYKTDDLRSCILHRLRGMEPQRAGCIPDKAGDTESHIGRIAEIGKRSRHDPADCARKGKLFLRI